MSQFADDTLLYSTAPTAEAQIAELNADLARIQQWCDTWRVDLKPSKCRHLVFDSRGRRDANATAAALTDRLALPSADGSSQTIPTAGSYRLLGVTFTSNLRFDKHVEEGPLKALTSQVGFLKRLTGGLGSEKRRVAAVIYSGVVRPRAEYASTVWRPGTSPALLEKLDVVQRKIARFVVGSATIVSNVALLAEVGWPTLEDRHTEQ